MSTLYFLNENQMDTVRYNLSQSSVRKGQDLEIRVEENLIKMGMETQRIG